MNLMYRNFKGIVPRLDTHLLSGEYAEQALDVNLWHGTVKPFREKALCHALKQSTKSVFYDDCCWKEFDKCVDFVRLNTTCSRQIVTGLFDYPVSACSTDCNPTWKRLGVPSPGDGPSVELLDPLKDPAQCYAENFIDSIDYARTNRTYVYTYVNACCDEGPPSYPSENIDVDDGGRVMVSGFNIPPTEYGVTSIRLYRLASAFDMTNTNIEQVLIDEKSSLSEYFFVGEFPIGENVFIDELMDYELGFLLETQSYTEPPASLQGVITVDGTQLAGFYAGNKIRFSMANFPHVWQEADELTVPDTIHALIEMNSDVIVLTCGAIYMVEPIKDCKTVGCRRVHKTLENYPLISCCGGHGYTKTPKGVVFVSMEGLILTDGRSAQNITSPYFAPDDWKALLPDRMSVVYHRDSIYFFSEKVSYCLQFPVSLSQWENSHLIQLSDRPQYAFSANEDLFLVEDGNVYRWGMGDKWRPYVWKGKKEISPTQVNFAGAKVSRYHNGNVKFKLFGDDWLIKEYDPVKTEKFRLPSGRRDIEFQLELSGTAEVYQVEISTSYRELSSL